MERCGAGAGKAGRGVWWSSRGSRVGEGWQGVRAGGSGVGRGGAGEAGGHAGVGRANKVRSLSPRTRARTERSKGRDGACGSR